VSESPSDHVHTEEKIRFCLQCGTRLETQEISGEKRRVCPHCGWVYYADPKVAAAGLIEQEGKILLVRRAGDPQRGLWTLPAGFVNAFEDPARAAERECLEETGLTVQVTELVDVIAGREHPRGADMVIIYRMRVLGGTLAAADDADQAGFFEWGDLPPLAFRATRIALGIESRE
jgi:8-oxo-dGTP diphosphatase